MTIEELNNLSPEAARAEFQKCCGADRWVKKMVNGRPFSSTEQLFQTAETIWRSLGPSDWKEAFLHHPKIGNIKGLREKFESTGDLAASEQSGVQQASEATLNELTRMNREYEAKFGYIFIVNATGKTADEMLHILKQRIENEPAKELLIAAEEQRKITRIRLDKMLK
jgi:2-oxo-4-hydroxy-4-carboxy-5-ureidoimidazoline decarboxylase